MSNICDNFIFSYEMSAYIFNFYIEIKNNDLTFDKFIKNYEAISHKSRNLVILNIFHIFIISISILLSKLLKNLKKSANFIFLCIYSSY